MLKKKIVPILCYALSAVLIAGYVAVLLIKPNVPEEYRMLYIDHLLSEWCGIDGLNYTLGTEVTYNNSGEQSSQFHNLGDGWSKREAKFTWTDSSTAYLYFRPQCESCELKITITCTILSDFDLYINDLLVGSSSELSDDILTCFYDFNEEDPMLVFRFEIHNPVRPSDVSDSTDTRELGVALRKIVIDSINYTLGTEVTYNNSDESSSQFNNLGEGWSHRESEFTWTDSSTAYLYFRPQCESQLLKITIWCTFLSDFDLYINDLLVGSSSELSDDILTCFYDFNEEDPTLIFRFEIHNPVRPSDVSDSTDTRELGVALRKIVIE